MSPTLQLVEVIGQVGKALLQPLPLAGVRDNNPWLGGGVKGITGQDLPVVEDALWEGLA